MSEPRRITVICGDPSHAPKVVTVDRLELYHERVVRSQERHHARAPQHSRDDMRWDRIALRCPVCGLDAQLRQATAQRLVSGLVDADMSEVRLEVLAGSL